jgi:hypothetical protein
MDPDTAIPWIMKHQASRLGEIDIEPLERWVETAPDAALAMLGHLPAENANNKDLPTKLLYGIASKQPDAALARLDLLQTKEQRNSVIDKALNTWSGRDITAASAYTDALPPGEDRQAAIGGILGAAFKESPESALTWATTLTDPERRAKSVADYLNKWRKKDSAAAQNWLDHAPLDDTLRQKPTPSQP